MKDKELTDYIVNQENFLDAFFVRNWMEGNPRFRTFAERYREKINNKFEDAKDYEDKRDIMLELNVANVLLLNRDLEVEYEKFGKKGPDLSISYRGCQSLNFEVTRIRDAPVTNRYYDFIASIKDAVCIVPSKLTFGLVWYIFGKKALVV